MRIKVSFARKHMMAVLAAAVITCGCMSSPEVRSARYVAAGKKLLEKHDANRAILQFLNAVQATPRNAEVRYQLALSYLAAADVQKGVANLRRTLELDPKHTAAQLRLAQLMTNASDPEVLRDAQRRLQRLIQDGSDNPDTLHALALTEFKLGEPQDAMQHLEQAMTAAPQDLAFAVTLADAKLQQKDYKGAEDTLRKACDNSPKSSDCIVILGRLYLLESRPIEAEQKFQQALGMDSDSAPALLNLATLENVTGRKQDAEQHFKRLSSLSDRTFRHFHAAYLFQEGRRDEAVKEFEKLYRQDSDEMARTRLVAVYQAVNRVADGHKVLNEALKKNPKDLGVLLQQGELFLSDRKYAEAESDLNQVLHLRPDSPEVHYALAKLHQARRETLSMREQLYEVLRLNPSLVAVRIELANSMIEENSKAALAILDAAPADQRKLISIVEQRNWALLKLQQSSEARKGIEYGLANARTADFLLQDAILKIEARRFPEARQAIHEALVKAPEDLRGLRLLVGTYAAQNQVRNAVEEVRAYATQHPKSAAIQFFLGSLLIETGDHAGAQQALRSAKAINPDYAPAELSLARVNLLQANWDDARRELNTILSTKEETPLARQWLAMLEYSIGDRTAALADFRRVVEIQPNNATALNNLAFLLAENGKPDEALKYAEKAVELAPGRADSEDTLGWILYRKGLYAAAITHLQLAVSKSGDLRLQYHLAAAYFRKGDEVRGREVLTAALRKDPTLPEAQLAQQAEHESNSKH